MLQKVSSRPVLSENDKINKLFCVEQMRKKYLLLS